MGLQQAFLAVQQIPPQPTAYHRAETLQAKVVKALASLKPENRHKLVEILASSPLFSSLFAHHGSHVEFTDQHKEILEQATLSVIKNLPPSDDDPALMLINQDSPTVQVEAKRRRQGTSRHQARDQVISPEVITEFKHYSMKGRQEINVVVSLKAKAVDASSLTKNKIAITSVLDVSGSMEGPRIKLLRGTTAFLVDQMTPEDWLGLVLYSSSASEILPLMRMCSPSSKKFAHCIIEGLQADGGTALFDGLCTGMRQILTADLPNGSSIATGVLLCTDGQANEGPATADEILPAIRREIQTLRLGSDRERDANCHCFGIGNGHDAALLQAISESLSGSYYFLSKTQDIAPGYGDLLASLKSTVAKGISLVIKTEAGISTTRTHGGKKETSSDGKTSISFSNLFDGETRELLLGFECAMPVLQHPREESLKIAEILISYTDLATGENVEKALPVEVKIDPASGPLAVAPVSHPLIVATAARYETSEVIEKAMNQSERGDMDEAEKSLRVHAQDLASKLAQVSLNSKATESRVKEAEEILQMLNTQVIAVADLTKKQRETRRLTLDLESKVAYQQASSTLIMQRAANVGGASALPASRTYDSEFRKASRASASASAAAYKTH